MMSLFTAFSRDEHMDCCMAIRKDQKKVQELSLL